MVWNSAKSTAHSIQKKVDIDVRFIFSSFLVKINKSLMGKDRALIRLELETLGEVFVNISRCGGIPLL